MTRKYPTAKKTSTPEGKREYQKYYMRDQRTQASTQKKQIIMQRDQALEAVSHLMKTIGKKSDE